MAAAVATPSVHSTTYSTTASWHGAAPWPPPIEEERQQVDDQWVVFRESWESGLPPRTISVRGDSPEWRDLRTVHVRESQQYV